MIRSEGKSGDHAKNRANASQQDIEPSKSVFRLLGFTQLSPNAFPKNPQTKCWCDSYFLVWNPKFAEFGFIQ